MRLIISDYIQKISLNDVIKFGNKNGVVLSNEEAKILFFYLKNNWEDLLYGDPTPIINEIKSELDINKLDKIVELFYFYRNKYGYYL